MKAHWYETHSVVLAALLVLLGPAFAEDEPPLGDRLPPADFLRGDCNENGMIEIGDAMWLAHILFVEVEELRCADACDANDDGAVNISDVIFIAAWVVGSSQIAPPEPFSECGNDPTSDGLGCTVYAGACP